MNRDFDIILKTADALTKSDIHSWRKLQSNDPTLDSPYYCPEFSETLHAIGKTVTVAIALNSQNDVIGILPFHRNKNGVGSPIGGPICDYQGIIGPLKNQMDAQQFLKACFLKAYDFNHLPLSQTALAKGYYYKERSNHINLENGYTTWRQERISAGIKMIKNCERKRRKIERENGKITFRFNDRKNNHAWEKLLEWKRLSYKEMGVRSILDVNWVLATLEHLRHIETEHFSSVLSTAYIGDELLTVDFGLKHKTTYHGWFASYNRGYKRYSPGLIMLLNFTKHAAENGIKKIDLGKGKERYKQSFSNGSTELCEGSIEVVPTLPGALRKVRKATHKSMSAFPALHQLTDFQRRGFNRFLKAGAMPDNFG